MRQDAEWAKADVWGVDFGRFGRKGREKMTAGMRSASRPQESGHIICCARREAEQVIHDS